LKQDPHGHAEPKLKAGERWERESEIARGDPDQDKRKALHNINGVMKRYRFNIGEFGDEGVEGLDSKRLSQQKGTSC
jgi:hypothetical protein